MVFGLLKKRATRRLPGTKKMWSRGCSAKHIRVGVQWRRNQFERSKIPPRMVGKPDNESPAATCERLNFLCAGLRDEVARLLRVPGGAGVGLVEHKILNPDSLL